jgi:hypothetical protein
MKKLLIGVLILGGLALAHEPVNGQTFQNGPYYANPAWDQQIPTAQRFIVLTNWNNAAVLDRETGLVWQRAPSASRELWSTARFHCQINTTGNRLGWRLPAVEELSSLLDPTQTNPALPPGHPFQGIFSSTAAAYWTSETTQTGGAATLSLLDAGLLAIFSQNSNNFFWCVRGGAGAQAPQ